jgi:hypothetical protein
MKSAVEMTPRGKREKLKKPKRVSHPFHRAWIPTKSGPTFPPRRRRILYSRQGRKNAAKTEFQLTDPGHFKHDKGASVASLRSCPTWRRNE